ncbi:hypothetical protein Tco_0662939 [Tanacetum coccineum]
MDVVATKDGVSHLTYTITCIMFHLTDSVKKEKQSSLVDTSIPTAEMDKLSSLEDTIVLGSFPPLSMPVTSTVGNAPGTLGILKKWHPDENISKEDVSTIQVWVKLHSVPVTTFSDDGLSAIATKLGTPLMLDSYTSDMCMQSWCWSSYTRVMIELRADVELKDNIVVAMRVRVARCLDMSVRNVQRISSAGATKTLKKTSQTPKRILVGQKMGFKPKQMFQPVLKKSTSNTRGKMNNPESTKERDRRFSSSNTPIGEKIDKIKRQICEDKLRFVDDDGNPLIPTGIVESDSEVEVIFDKTANLRISTSGKDGSDKGYGTNSLMEQWRDSYPDNDDYHPYDDDMYENHDIFDKTKVVDLLLPDSWLLESLKAQFAYESGERLSNLELFKKLCKKNRHEGDHCDATKVARARGIIANVVDLALDLHLDPEA